MIKVKVESDDLSDFDDVEKVAAVIHQALHVQKGTVVQAHSNVAPATFNLDNIKMCVVAELPKTLIEEEAILILERVRNMKEIGPTVLGTMQMINQALGTKSHRYIRKVETE